MASSPSTYNILFLGETQSGKSTLIEHLKKYADPNYVVNCKVTGDSVFSFTKSVLVSTIHTNNPEYFITSRKTKERVDYGEFINEDQKDYEDKLYDRNYSLEREEPDTPKVAFNLIDTPGFNNATLFDEANIAIIFQALASIEFVNLLAFTVPNNPFTEGLMDNLKAFVDLLPEFNGNIVFVHTKIDYAKLHPQDDSQFAESLKEKKKILAQLVGRNSVPHILIDNDIDTQEAVRNCITQNTLRNLLDIAKINLPVSLRQMRMNKTEKMRVIDALLAEKCEAKIEDIMSRMGTKNNDQKEILERINKIKTLIIRIEEHLKRATEYLIVNDNDTLELLHEELYQQNFSILNLMEGVKTMYYPGKKRTAEPGFRPHTFDHIDIRSQNIKILQDAGGKGYPYWAVRFRRRKNQSGLFHVKIYITRGKKFAQEILSKKTEVIMLKGQLEDHTIDLAQFKATTGEHSTEMKGLLDDLNLWHYLLSQVNSAQLESEIFLELMNSGTYVHDIATSARNVEKFYIDRRLEKPESGTEYVVPDPVETSEVYATGDGEVLEVPDTPLLSRPSTPKAPPSPQEVLKYSVLMIGKTQSGKTKFIEFVKKYVDPQYKIKWELIGNGIESKTSEPEQCLVESGVPKYQVYRSNDVTKTPINLSVFADSYDDPNEYFDALRCRKTTLHLVLQDSNLPPQRAEVTFLDTPGIEDTRRQDEKHAKAIIENIIELRSVNLIIINVNGKNPASKYQALAFDYFSKVIQTLQGHHSNVIFLHTHVKYENCHRSNKDHMNLTARHEAFCNFFRGFKKVAQEGSGEDTGSKTGSKLFPMYTIDMCEKHRPIPDCMMKNTLKEVLELVLESPPALLDTSDTNMRRVWAIKHPDHDNNKLHKRAQVRLQAEAVKQQRTNAVVPSKGDVVEVDPEELDEVEDSAFYFEGALCLVCGEQDCNCDENVED